MTIKNITSTIVSAPIPFRRSCGWGCLFMMAGLHLQAQSISIEYTTELQSDLRKCNFVNLLHLSTEVPIGNTVAIEASTISIAKTREERLVDDLQTFSNIEEDNMPLAIAVCGVNWQINDKHSFFTGIRNMNEDYFTSPVTSFFTNSSCGIYPTLSANYPIANYPLAAVGMHYSYDGHPVRLQASLYNGIGYKNFTGRNNVFRFCPQSDGVFGLAQVEYEHSGSCYFLGNSFCNNNGTTGATPWLYAEQKISNNLSMLAGCSHAFAEGAECKDLVILGVHSQFGKYEVGMSTDYAHFAAAREFATEISCKASINPNLYLQPTLHIIQTADAFHAIGMLRMGWTI